MKIFYVSSSWIPSRSANSIQVMKMCQALVEIGHQPTLVVPKIPPKEKADCVWSFYNIKKRFPLTKVAVRSVFRGHDFTFNVGTLSRRENVDLVYSRHLMVALWSSVLGVPAIFEMHTMPNGKRAEWYLGRLLKRKNFKRLVVISHALKNAVLVKFGEVISEEKIVVAHSGVGLEQFANTNSPKEARAALGIKEQFTATYAGHLYPGKGFDVIAKLAKNTPDVQFLVVGGDPASVEACRKLIAAESISNIVLTGFVPNSEVRNLLSAGEILLMPYQSQVGTSGGKANISKWMSPLKVFEYMAANRPIVSSDLPVLKEVLCEQNAILCPPEDIAAWRRAIIQLRDHPELGCALASKARKDVESYSWEKRAELILSH